ncbi:unnamed protein product [Ceutorhynchus assimilis]|uniref:TIL domain-containing protein n=1 Tax=Ceutorhynchus assimilis TaxID=467358 RepID=A0A9N9MDT8_9CUCU|nr:unnamed protein product [Ceutorhynchus assimilis]
MYSIKAIFALVFVCLMIFEVHSAATSRGCSQPFEEYNSCGSACEENCSGVPQACILVCKQGCFCRHGYVRGSNGNCIQHSEC